jgi:hypothetical protein
MRQTRSAAALERCDGDDGWGETDVVVRRTGDGERRLLRLGLMLTGGVHSAEDPVQTVFARSSS